MKIFQIFKNTIVEGMYIWNNKKKKIDYFFFFFFKYPIRFFWTIPNKKQ